MQKIKKVDWHKKTRRGFIASGIFGMFTLLVAKLWPFETLAGLNERVWRKLYRQTHLGENPDPPAPFTKSRINGKYGLQSEFTLEDWTLSLDDQELSLKQIQQLPPTETTEVFKCIEGWSQTISYKGVSGQTFLNAYQIGKKSSGEYYKYVGLETPDGEYYVSLDIESFNHPKTVLAWEINGQTLSLAQGAPLRLIIPVKYGIKNLKRIGTIFFSDEKPPDYWHEQGYDWYAAL